MIRFHQGGGASDFEILGAPMAPESWVKLRQTVCRLLRAQDHARAADLLESVGFDLYEGTNFFGDEFSVLYTSVPVERYVELSELTADPQALSEFRALAQAMGEAGMYVRFIAVDLAHESGLAPVASPSPTITSAAVERALADARSLVRDRSAGSGVDRVHTAFHGYLRAVCSDKGISIPQDASATELFKVLREHHPAFRASGPRSEDVSRILRSMASIVDSLNTLRNRASGAHPNEAVLEEPEAMLVINSVHTLLHYMDSALKERG